MENPFDIINRRLTGIESLLLEIKHPIPTPGELKNDFLTIEEAASMLSVSVPTVYGYVYKKEIPYMKRRGRLYFDRAEVSEWLKSSRRMTREEIRKAATDSLAG